MTRSPASTAALLALAGASLALLGLPLVGLVSRSPWTELGSVLELARPALGLSLLVSSSAVGLALLLGAPVAWLLARTQLPGRRVLRALVALPMVLPPVVAGVALLAAFGRRGLLGTPLYWLGIELPFTTAAAILAAAFVSAPLLISALEAGLAQHQTRYDDVAATLGAGRLRTLLHVTLPSIRPALTGGVAMCWARSLGEFGATIAFAGNLEGVTQTAPLAIYELLQTRPEHAFLLGSVLLLVALILLAALRFRSPPA